MEHFNYRLQNVLDFKLEIEDKKKKEFVQCLKIYMQEEKKLKDLIERKKEEESKKDLKNGADCISYARYINYLENAINIQHQNVKKSKEKLEKSKEELLKSTSDRKVLEKLKDKAFEEFMQLQNKKEQNLNDDYAIYSFIRNERR